MKDEFALADQANFSDLRGNFIMVKLFCRCCGKIAFEIRNAIRFINSTYINMNFFNMHFFHSLLNSRDLKT